MAIPNIQKQIDIMDQSIVNVLKKKYFMEGESTYDEMVLNRFKPALDTYITKFKEKISTNTSINQKNIDEYIETIDSVYQKLLESLLNKHIIPGGSITYKLGNNTNASFSNCYYTPIESDSMEGIFEASTKLAKIFQYRGGSGIDLSILRPEGAVVHNSARTSSGPVSFMPKFAADADIVGQNGRRAALMISMCIWHPDIMKFIKSKAYPEEVFHINPLNGGKLPDISTANISVKLTPDFIDAYFSNTKYDLRFPDITDEHYATEWKGDLLDWEAKGYKVIVYNTVDPHDIMYAIAECAHKCGDPGVLNWKATVNKSLGYFDDRIKPKGVNPCAEQSLPDYGNCLLSAINLSAFVKRKWDFIEMKKRPVAMNIMHYYDIQGLRAAVAANTLFLNLLIDNNTHPLSKNNEQDVYSRRIGIEFTALADTLAMLGLEYGKAGSIRFARLITFTILDAAMEFSNKLSRMGIVAPALSTVEQLASFISQPMMEDIYYNVVELADDPEAIQEVFGTDLNIVDYINNSFLHKYLNYIIGPRIDSDVDNVEEVMRKHFIDKVSKEAIPLNTVSFANTSFNTVGPTGTISIVAGHVTSGIEPLFAIAYKRMSTLTDGKPMDIVHYPILEYISSNAHLMDYIQGREPDLSKLNFTIREFNLMKSFIDTGDYNYLKELFYYVDAASLDAVNRMHIQESIQKFVDASVSSTINLPEDTSIQAIYDIYQHMLASGDLKGITIYRAGSKDGILITATDNKKDKDEEESTATDNNVQTTYGVVYKKKRAQEEQAYSFCYTWKGAKIYINVTIDAEGMPIEVFTNLPKEAGFVTITQPDGTQIKEFSDTVYREHTNNWHLACRLTSLLLRTGCPVSEIMSQLDKATFNTFTDIAALINRAISRVYKSTLEESGALEDLEEAINKGNDIDITSVNSGDVIISKCPSCGKQSYIHSGGCSYCINDACGYSKCS